MRKISLIIFIITGSLLYQTNLFSKIVENNNFNQKYLSSYFSALLSYDNQNNQKALKYFNSSKFLLNKHDKFLREYIFSLVENGELSKAIKQIKLSKNKNSSKFFEAKLLLVIDDMKKKKFSKAKSALAELIEFQGNGTYEYIIYETLKSYNNLFFNNIIDEDQENFGKLSLITLAFQNCFKNSDKTSEYFINLINTVDGDYSRYIFFYLANLASNKNFEEAKNTSSSIESLSSGLLILQAKEWIDTLKFKKFNQHFSCKSSNDLLAEFFFLISNLYSSQEEYQKSNFYLNISNFLNPKFYFNLSLLAENYILNENYEAAKKIYKKFNNNDQVYRWYKIKQIGKIIEVKQNDEEALLFIENEFKKIKNPSIKILFDLANIYKRNKNFNKSIKYYSTILLKLEKNSDAYASILYRRGGSYERLGDYKSSDKDLIKSLEINPDAPYVLNYLAYSWLERKYKIDEAIEMLGRAYSKKKNDPYIIDSVGWGYYLIGDYLNAEKYIKKAVILMPDDPIVNDHYGDILWMLNRKLQAKYFWENVLNLESSDDEMKKKIKEKLLNGPNKI
tara:strand:- start:686 stop:2374 length:1689 start_codon:yes stop_codon:yes gene_type:complete